MQTKMTSNDLPTAVAEVKSMVRCSQPVGHDIGSGNSSQNRPPETSRHARQSNGVAYIQDVVRLRGLLRFMKRFFCLIVIVMPFCGLAAAADSGFLPQSFAGWTQTGMPQITHDVAKADAAYPAVLQEYGFTEAETATYTRPDGRTLTIKAAQFKDATGAYGAFTFYRQPEMRSEQIGSKAASANNRTLFFRSNVLVDANFDRLTGMSAAELRELAASLPAATGANDRLPGLPEYLPRQHEVENSAHFVLGPQALTALGAPITAEQVDFAYDPEILEQQYSLPDGPVTLMLLQYPTPQIAGERFRALQPVAAANSNGLALRRTGPILVVLSGAVANSDARSLLGSVNYEAEVTWDEATSIPKSDNVGSLIIGVFSLIGVVLLITLIVGIFFGGFRVLMKRLFPNRVFDRPESREIIQLHIDEEITFRK